MKQLVCSVGISDNGKYKKYISSKRRNTREYDMWQKMLSRCYKSSNNQNPTYIGCVVSDEFLSFQTFAEFYNQNKWCDDRILIPDKDILTHGKEKIYSRDTIIFVDKFINTIFTKRQNKRGKYPLGVSDRIYPSGNIKYIAVCNEYGKDKYLGSYYTIHDAFLAYKTEKEKYIKEVANKYKKEFPNFPKKLYDAMIKYEVFEND